MGEFWGSFGGFSEEFGEVWARIEGIPGLLLVEASALLVCSGFKQGYSSVLI